MKPLRFLLYCVLIALPIVAGLAVYGFIAQRYIPAPKLTRNIALNEQWRRLAQLPANAADVLAVGSSMTLNNLASDVVVEHLGERTYTNAAAWGLGVSELEKVAPTLIDHFHPRTVIVVHNLIDFEAGMELSTADSAALAHGLDGHWAWTEYLRHVDAPYYLRQLELNRIRFTDAGNYEYLRFDAHGGVGLVVPPQRIDKTRFNNEVPAPHKLHEERYAAFQRMVEGSSKSGVDLVVVLAPYRDGIRTPAAEATVAAHAARLRTMLQPYGYGLIDANERHWPDTMYCDASHFNAAGAREFTAWCMQRLDSIGTSNSADGQLTIDPEE